MKVHYPVWAVCVVGALTVAAGCKQDRGSATRQVVNIGLVAPLTGNVADLGREMMNSAKLAAREASEKHPDFEFRIVARDDQTSATGASTAATGLAAQRGVLALVGAGETPQVRAEIEALKGLSVPLVNVHRHGFRPLRRRRLRVPRDSGQRLPRGSARGIGHRSASGPQGCHHLSAKRLCLGLEEGFFRRIQGGRRRGDGRGRIRDG